MKSIFKRGFSLIELIVVIAVISAISAVIIPTISGTQDVAKEQKAIAGAEALNLAMVQWRLQDADAWPADSAARYVEIQPYLDFSPATLAAYNALYDGYSFTINGNKEKVTINVDGGGVVAY